VWALFSFCVHSLLVGFVGLVMINVSIFLLIVVSIGFMLSAFFALLLL